MLPAMSRMKAVPSAAACSGDRGGPDAGVGLGVAVMPLLVLDVVTLERGVIGGDVANAHAAADLAPEMKHAEPLLFAHRPPAEPRVPADRLVDEGREHVEEILVRDVEGPVLLVHARQRPAPPLAFIAALH